MKHYKLAGKVPVEATIEEWAELLQDDAARRVAMTKIGNVAVSTVFLGYDADMDELRPGLFETLVMWQDDEEIHRYTTWEEAEIGHAIIVDRVLDQMNEEREVEEVVKSLFDEFKGTDPGL